jgi:glucan 1,3-beta-glucosidase
MPTDPRTAEGKCLSLGTNSNPFDGSYLPWQTGGAGAGTITPTATSAFPWPPPTLADINVNVAQLPMYTPTGTIVTLPPPSITATGVSSMNGWADNADNTPAPTPISGCNYPNAWDAVTATVPASGCSTGV